MKKFHFIIKSKQQNKQTNKQSFWPFQLLPWFSGQPGLRVLRLLYPM
jgi:hypothetical protein